MTPTIVTVPCFSGAPWDLEQLTPLADQPLRTMRLPEAIDDIEGYADFVAEQVGMLDNYVVVGDSFGAVVALAFATRRPRGLHGLVVSGGFAADPVTSPVLRARILASRLMPGMLYEAVTLRFHAASLTSPYDLEGQLPWPAGRSRDLFMRNTPHRSYVARARAAFAADYRGALGRIEVPTLILTPEHDELIGPDAARVMLEGIPRAEEVVIPRTGHMFRFSHPETYAAEVAGFLRRHGLNHQAPRGAFAAN
jgi:pimeloyl-ACP methyl ester carboxylesterase